MDHQGDILAVIQSLFLEDICKEKSGNIVPGALINT